MITIEQLKNGHRVIDDVNKLICRFDGDRVVYIEDKVEKDSTVTEDNSTD